MKTINKDYLPLKIGLTGKMRSGKDQVADLLQAQLEDKGESVHILGFAEGIKELLTYFTPKVFEEGKPRYAYQRVGQVMREVYEDVWVDRTVDRITLLEKDFPKDSIIVKDVRQPNEYSTLKDKGYTIIKVEADTEVRVARSLSSNDSFDISHLYHETELGVEDIEADYVINNSGSMDELEQLTEELLIKLLNESNNINGGNIDEYHSIR